MDEAIRRIEAEPSTVGPGVIRVFIWGYSFHMETAEAQELRDKLNTALGMVAH